MAKKKKNTPGQKVPLRSSSPASCCHELHHHSTMAGHRQLSKDSAQGCLLVRTACPIFQPAQHTNSPSSREILKLLWPSYPRAISAMCNAGDTKLNHVPCSPTTVNPPSALRSTDDPSCPQSYHRPHFLRKQGLGQRLGMSSNESW